MTRGIVPVLLLLFVTLKLIGVEPVASWSWLWVFSPVWIGLAFIGAFFVVGAIVCAVSLVLR